MSDDEDDLRKAVLTRNATKGSSPRNAMEVPGADTFRIAKLLGVGSQGKVYLVQLTDTDEYYAMKVFRKEQIVSNVKTTDSILTEHRFLASSVHPFITSLFYSFHSNERLFMIMEYCPGGELFTAIKKQPNGRLTEDQVKFYASEVICVLEYVHSKGYIYRDLKPENILLHLDGHIRMADFGLSKQQEGYQMKVTSKRKRRSFMGKKETVLEHEPGAVVWTNSLVGSVHYLAPEVLQCIGYDCMADWWAVGVLMYDMLFGYPPFQGKTNHEVFTKILNCEYRFPDDVPVSPIVKDLIKRLLRLDPRKRLGARHGAEDIKKHTFFEGVHWSLLRNRKPPIVPIIDGPEDTSNFMVYEDDENEDAFSFFSELEPDSKQPNPPDSKFSSFRYSSEKFDGVMRKRSESIALKNGQSPTPQKERRRSASISGGRSSVEEGAESVDGDSSPVAKVMNMLTPRSRKKRDEERKRRSKKKSRSSPKKSESPRKSISPRKSSRRHKENGGKKEKQDKKEKEEEEEDGNTENGAVARDDVSTSNGKEVEDRAGKSEVKSEEEDGGLGPRRPQSAKKAKGSMGEDKRARSASLFGH